MNMQPIVSVTLPGIRLQSWYRLTAVTEPGAVAGQVRITARLDGLEDTRFGVTVARKALLPASLVINSRPTQEVARWLARH